MSGDCYAIVLHYTGNASDEDGITAQYVKISANGKVTAHFNSFSPIAIIVTNVERAQTLVNTYSHGMGSDEIGADTATTAAGAATAVTQTADAAATAEVATANEAVSATAASPKTGDVLADAEAIKAALLMVLALAAAGTLFASRGQAKR